MKLPKSKKFGANADEKETYLPKQYDCEIKFDEIRKR